MAILLTLILANLFVQLILGQQSVDSAKMMKNNLPEKIQHPLPDFEARIGSGEYPCPDAEAIAPCTCTSYYSIYLNCDNVTSAQLATIFQQDFPVKNIYELIIKFSPLLTSLDFDLNGVTMETLFVADSAVATIAPKFLEGSYETLNYITLESTELTTEGFPFETLVNYNNLTSVSLSDNNMDSLPIINSPSLQQLQMEHTRISEILPGELFDCMLNLLLGIILFSYLIQIIRAK